MGEEKRMIEMNNIKIHCIHILIWYNEMQQGDKEKVTEGLI
jgi:hypothetical protein